MPSSSIYHTSIASGHTSAGIMSSAGTNLAGSMAANMNGSDPLLRGGAGLHRCDVCECCMTVIYIISNIINASLR